MGEWLSNAELMAQLQRDYTDLKALRDKALREAWTSPSLRSLRLLELQQDHLNMMALQISMLSKHTEVTE
jgi:site-specific recombinase XerC